MRLEPLLAVFFLSFISTVQADCDQLSPPLSWANIQATGTNPGSAAYNASKTEYCYSVNRNGLPYPEFATFHIDLADPTVTFVWETVKASTLKDTCSKAYPGLNHCYSRCKDPAIEGILANAIATADWTAPEILTAVQTQMAAAGKADWPIFVYAFNQNPANQVQYQYYLDNNYCAVLAHTLVQYEYGEFQWQIFVVTNKNL